ncbi:hypothetical protein [Streptomyces zingiberis]|uniref:HPt domain-containing protein n=1 Tax=Streptomyces zingiberis TaxID=2053010 RepID=A0ABX1BVH9_9ACTN|nr:hypothetical protein [Streptomyces zingiberis]NJQ01726.1 hypothetical protein [Streptomyces zingiberis]
MLFMNRHLLHQHLMELPGIVDAYAAREAGFVDGSLNWLAAVEKTLLRLRHPLTGLIATTRGEVLAARDGHHRRGGELSPPASTRRVQQAATAVALRQVETSLRDVVESIDRQLDGYREKMAQLLAVASNAEPIPAGEGRSRDAWLRSVWDSMAGTKETAGMHAYLNAAMARGDVLALLGEVLENLLAAAGDPDRREEHPGTTGT